MEKQQGLGGSGTSLLLLCQGGRWTNLFSQNEKQTVALSMMCVVPNNTFQRFIGTRDVYYIISRSSLKNFFLVRIPWAYLLEQLGNIPGVLVDIAIAIPALTITYSRNRRVMHPAKRSNNIHTDVKSVQARANGQSEGHVAVDCTSLRKRSAFFNELFSSVRVVGMTR